jgi:polysaccharide export outer membrane protein
MRTISKLGTCILALLCVGLVPLAAQQGALQAAPPKQVPGYIIGPNDVLRVTVYSGGISQPDFAQGSYTVQTDGSVALPLLKPVKIAGLSVIEANALIRTKLLDSRQFSDCIVDVTMMQYRSSTLTVQGAVRLQGTVQMTADRMNVADALNQAGGLQPSAGSQIKVKRAPGHVSREDVTLVDGWEVYSREDLNTGLLADVQLFDGDRIEVPVAPQYYVQGYVARPGDMQWEPGLTLEKALVKVGGITKEGSDKRIKISRLDPKTKEYKEVKLNKKKMSTLVEPEDVIYVGKRIM